MIINRLLFISMMIAAVTLAASCMVGVRRPGIGVYANVPLVSVAPPAPRHEIIGFAPRAGYVWIEGYWGWTGRSYQWQPGHWEAPRQGHYWIPYRWQRDGHGWRHHGGHWERRR